MTEELLKRLLSEAAKIEEEIEAISGSTSNGQLIDAANHIKSVSEHLKRYYALKGGKL